MTNISKSIETPFYLFEKEHMTFYMKRSESPLPKDPIGKGMALHLNKVKFPSSKDAMGKFG